jgi:hypothetical protein
LPYRSFYLIRLVTRRLLQNVESAEFDAMATLSPQPKPKAGTSPGES